ncbi:MAG: YitT family protein, partial [Paenibacillaceae bacterium]|nr:YitT family protein [Paenibacillaceae bacterium]
MHWKIVIEWCAVCVGSFVCALGFSVFLAPNDIASGGVQGISLIVRAHWGVSPALTQWLLNVPLYVIGVVVLGRSYGVKTLFGSIALPFFVQITEHIAPVTTNILWASLVGGLIVGLGVGLVFSACASTGGWDIVAQILARVLRMPVGMAVAVCDGLVIAWAAWVFGL